MRRVDALRVQQNATKTMKAVFYGFMLLTGAVLALIISFMSHG
jgi:hypothetical protein